MRLYLITQVQSTGYDTYDSAIVAALSSHDAKTIHPSPYVKGLDDWGDGSWATGPMYVRAKEIGLARASIKRGVVLASFNAG